MSTEGKMPLDNRTDAAGARAGRFAEIERQSGETIGVKEMALTKKPRDEDAGKRAGKFLEIDRRAE